MRIGRAWGRWRGRKQRAGKAPTVGAAGRARAERTENMLDMLMTLDVLRLSDWLNADAPCRVEREAWQEGRHVGWEAGGVDWSRCKQRAGRPRLWRTSVRHARSAPKTWTPCL